MATIKIFLKNKDEISTPKKIILEKGSFMPMLDRANVESFFSETPIANNSYLLFLIDDKDSVESNNYDYFLNLKIVHPNPYNILPDNESSDLINITNSLIYDNKSSYCYKLRLDNEIHYNLGNGDDSVVVLVNLEKKLKNRNLRTKGVTEFYFDTPISEIIYPSK